MSGDVGALPTRLGRYEVLGLVGRGSFADVVRAWDEALAAHLAIKILTPTANEDELVRRRFVEEGQLLRRVHSVHVVAIHDIGELEDGRPYLVMDLADGGTLADRLDETGGQPVEADTVSRVVERLGDGLTALHEAGVVHRDIKPENLLIDGDRSRSGSSFEADTVLTGGVFNLGERLLISDLGLAKDMASRGSAPSVIGGSARYQAPEQLRADGLLGPPTDVYAASAVLWRLLTGKVAPEPHDVSDSLTVFKPGWQAFFERAMAMDPADRHPTAVAWRSAALDQLQAEPSAVVDGNQAVAYGRACPYKGLASFQPEDADVFFGREDLVDELLRRLQMTRVLVVAGPSGSGKSSAVRAGLLPALRNGALPGSDSWRFELFTPGGNPFDELHYRLARGSDGPPSVSLAELRDDPRLARRMADDAGDDRGWLLYVDQFEELFTQPDDPKVPAAFIDALSSMVDPADSRVRIVLAVRADFYGRCAQVQWLANRITENQVLVGPMSNENMRRAIEEPARRSGLRFEPGLVDAVLDEAGHGPSSLPLISHALMETWARRDGNVLTFAGFRAAGGVAGAIARSADDLFEEKFDGRQQAAARRLLLRLVTPGEGTADSRRLLPLNELERDSEPAVMSEVVDAFVAARLLSVDQRAVEIAHEALIGGWPRLRDWIDDERENLRFRQRIARAAGEWDTHDRDPDLLWRGAPLATAVDWAGAHSETLDRLEREFVDEAEEARLVAAAAAARREARAQRTRRLATAALAALTVASIAASIVALVGFRRANGSADIAEQQFANALGTSSVGRARSDPAQALLLAVESIDRSESPGLDARSGMVQARLELAAPNVYPLGPPVLTPGSFRVALRPDGAVAAVADQTGPIRLYDVAEGEQIGADLRFHEAGARTLAFTSEGTTLVSGSSDGLTLAWDLTDPDSVPSPRVISRGGAVKVWAVTIASDDRRLAVASDDGVIRLFDLESGSQDDEIVWDEGAGITAVAFSPDGNILVASNREGRLNSWDAHTGEPRWPDDATPTGAKLWEIVFSADGTRFATAGDRDTVHVHDSATGATLPGYVFGKPGGTDDAITKVLGIAFLPDGSRLLGGDAEGRVHSWDLSDPTIEPTSSIVRHGDQVRYGDLSADGAVYVTVSDDKNLRAWRTATEPISVDIDGFADGAYGAAFDPTSDRLVVGDGQGSLHLFDLASAADADSGTDTGTGAIEGLTVGSAIASTKAHDGPVFKVVWSADGSRLASIGDDGKVAVWDPATLEETKMIGQHQARGRGLAFSPDGRLLVSSDRGDERGQGADVFIWDVEKGSLHGQLPPQDQGVRTVAFSNDGDWLATADGLGEIWLWDTDGFELIRQWTGTEQINPVWGLSFSDDGLLGSVDSSEDLRVWDPKTGEQVGRSIGGLGTNGATGLGFDGTGRTLATVTRNGELHLVDWQQGIDLAASPIVAHNDDANSFELSFDDDGVRFVTTGTDGTARIWDLLSADRACEVAAERLDPSISEDLFDTTDPIACR